MPQSDIYLRSGKTTAVGSLEVATGRDADADVRVNPNSAAVQLGGGGGDYSDGDLLFSDRDDQVRIHVTGGTGSRQEPSNNRVYVDGSTGKLRLGAESTTDGDYDVELFPRYASLELGGGAGANSDGDIVMEDREATDRIHVDAGGNGPTSAEPTVYVAGGELDTEDAWTLNDDHQVTIQGARGAMSLGGDGEAGRLDVNPGGTYDTATIDGESARLSLGGAPERAAGVSGELTLYNSRDVGTLDLDAASGVLRVGSIGYRGTSRGAQSGAVEVVHESGETTAELRGDEGGVVAGGAGKEGSVMLKNGNGEPVGLLEADGDELVLADGTGTPVLRVGSGGSIEFPQGGP